VDGARLRRILSLYSTLKVGKKSCPNFVPLTNQKTGQGYKPKVRKVVDFVGSPDRSASGLADHL
jgi:hypothetical protein